MAGIQGLRGTGEFDTNVRPTNYRELFTLLEPNGNAPFNALLAMGQSESTDDPKYNNFRDEMPDRRIVVGSGHSSDTSATTVSLTDTDQNGYVVKGSIIVNSATGEVMRATADADTAADTVTVERNIGGTSLAINSGDEMFVAGYAALEGDDVPTAISFDPVVDFNYTQIFRTSFKVTGTLQNTYRRIGDAEDEYASKALKMHMADIERAMFFGKRHISNAATAQPTRFTGGLTTLMTTVKDGASDFNASNVITEDEFDRLLIDTVFAYGSKEKIAFVGPTVAGHLQKFGKDRWQPTAVEGTYGVNVTRYKTFAGDLMVHLHPQFRQVPGMADAMVIVDFPYVRYRHLSGRDTALLRDRQANGVDAAQHEYLTECGLELLQDKVHTYIKGWQSIA